MAKKFLKKIQNQRPTGANGRIKNIGYYEEVDIPDSDEPLILQGEIPVIKNAWFEVGDAPGSLFTGVDGNNIPLQNVTWAEHDPKFLRKEYPTEFSSSYDYDRDSQVILGSKFYYQQEVKSENKGKLVPQNLHNLRGLTAYDEEYFSHIFNWPTEHILKTRTVGGFVREIITNTLTTPPTVTHNLYTVTATYSGNIELASTSLDVAYIDVNNDEEWSYVTIPFDSTGRIASEEIKQKIGNPVIYYGDTNSNCIFFFYSLPSNQVGTTNLLAIGDTVNGCEILNCVNYLTDFEVKRIVTKHSKKNDATDPYLQLNTVLELEIGQTVTGKGISPGTLITGVDFERNRIYLNQPITRKKVKGIRIRSEAVNRINRNTLCYAQIGPGSNFTVDTVYPVIRNGQNTGINIKVMAGRGIINRAAVTGIYSTYQKKEIEYQPIFFTDSRNCEKTYIEDQYGKYILGTALDENSELMESEFFLISPSSHEAYLINGAYMITLNRPATQEEIRIEMEKLGTKNILEIITSLNAILPTKSKIVDLFDDSCHDPVFVEYSQVYDTIENISNLVSDVTDSTLTFRKVTNSVISGEYNSEFPNCIRPDSVPTTSYSEILRKFETIIQDSIQTSTYLNPDYYESLVSGENSIYSRINEATESLSNSIPRSTRVENAPPEIEGEDASGIRNIRSDFYALPVSTDRVQYFISDVSILTDDYLNANLDLNPKTTVNQPKIVFRVTPRYEVVTTSMVQNNPDIASILHNVNLRGDGSIDTITTSPGPIVFPPPIPGIIVNRFWVSPMPKDYAENIRYGEKSGSYPDQYIIATSVNVHPNLRDLDNRDFDEEGDINTPSAFVYPQILFAENISYQRDLHQICEFRMEEISENLTESIENRGNPFIDSPILARLTSELKEGDTEISVESTEGFLSSGYLIIPKYVRKVYYTESGNKEVKFFYCGEEIIYYQSKTENRFLGCIRACFDTREDFEIQISANEIEVDVRYKIVSLGDTNWEQYLGTTDYGIGTEFVAKTSFTGTGIVTLVGSTNSEFPSEEPISGVINNSVIATTNSYQPGFSLAQYWTFELIR